jgi:hypothetical protein
MRKEKLRKERISIPKRMPKKGRYEKVRDEMR